MLHKPKEMETGIFSLIKSLISLDKYLFIKHLFDNSQSLVIILKYLSKIDGGKDKYLTK